MCGIVGSLQWHKGDSPALIQRMTQSLSHRGPDAENIVALEHIVLGHRRLSIIDGSEAANQPMRDLSQRYWIIFNGEIYNFKQLRKELEKRGHVFTTKSDTEVILEAWKCWGIKALDQLSGMFAFALWDSKEETLVLARDRLGEKPLYYYLENTYPNCNLIFASELQALTLHPKISGSVSPKAISEFLSLNYVLSDSCILEGVQKLLPAHYLILKKGSAPKIAAYWNLETHFQEKKSWKNKAEATEQLQALIEDCVTQQLVSDVPLGAFLSGGIDSSTIVAAMTRQNNPKQIKTFSIGFQEKTYSELAESQQVARHLQVDHHSQIVDADMATLLPKILQSADEPFADTSLIPTYFLAKFSREKVSVCLSGDEGDELFSGYETYIADKFHAIAKHLPNNFLKLSHALIEKCMPVSQHKVSLDYKLKQFLKGAQFDFFRAHYFWRVIFSDQEKKQLLKPAIKDIVMATDPFLSFLSHYQKVLNCHPLDQASYVDIKTWLVDDILFKVDRFTMAHSLEARAPFLDHRLVEFAASLPVAWKLKGLQKKHILKLSQKSYLPHNILHRSKKGFNAPIAPWFSGKLQALGKELTLDNRGALGEWFEINFIEGLWQEHVSGLRDHSLKLFSLMSLGLWFEKHRNLLRNRVLI